MPIPSLRPRKSRLYGAVSSEVRERFNRHTKRWWLTFALKAGLIFAGFSLIAGTITVLVVSRELPDPNKVGDRQVAQSTKIYDRTGTHLLYEIYQNQKRTVVDLSQMSPFLPKAFVAVEDKYFYEHNGVRVLSILRAGFNNLIGRKSGGGGASTMTQQFIKNAIVGDSHSIFRKIKEAILALRLERKYTKDEIMKMYLNEIPLGSTNYGVESAAQSYFRKSALDLTLAESATLAAMNQAPSRYLNNLESLRSRRDLVLGLMRDQGYITDEERKQAQTEPLKMSRNSGILAAPHFVLYVKQQLADQFGEKVVDTGGLKVITSLDYDKQVLAEKIVKEQGDKFAKSANANNAALVAIDPKTAQIVAMVGSRNFEDETIDGQFNVATLGRRQPGSSFKPFVYLAAFEKGYTPETVVYDVTTNFDSRDGNSYTPKNYDGKEHGLLTFRSSLQNSLNIPAVKAMYLVGTKETIEFAKRFGYSTFTGDYGLSLVLGGGEVNLLEHTNAYATLANNGRYQAPVSIIKVTNSSGEVMHEWQQGEGVEAVKPELAALLSNVLSDDASRALVFGRNSNLTLGSRPVAAKTGTTNDSKDAWTMGYVPTLAAGVWVGNTTPSPMKGGGNLLAGVIWNQFMRESLKDVPEEVFPMSPPNDAQKPVLTGSDGGIKLPINTVTGKIATSSTPENLITTKTFLPPHDILHYVQKDDPRGEPPAQPTDDPQYTVWEEALLSWVGRQQAAGTALTLEEPPTEYDSPQSPELTPSLQVVSPGAGTRITTRQLDFVVQASAPRGVARVLYSIDGTQVAESIQFPFGASYYAQKLTSGPHLLKVIAQDDMGNSAVQEIPFMLDVPLDPPSFEWLGENSRTLIGSDFPHTLFIEPFRWDSIRDIKVYLQGGGSTERLIYTFSPATEKLLAEKLSFTWKNNPGNGAYTLRGVMTDTQGRVVEKILYISVE
jgi:1A family penicillin-binding protein